MTITSSLRFLYILGGSVNNFDKSMLQYRLNAQPKIQIFNGLYLSITGMTLYAISDAPPTG